MKVKNQLGFTMIEVIVVVAILGIVAMIAIPTYKNHVMKSNRSIAQSTLQNIMTQQEQFYVQNNNSYTTNMTTLYSPSPAPTSNFYDYTLSSCGTGCIQATATAKSTQTEDTNCLTMTLTSSGQRTATTPGCWQQ